MPFATLILSAGRSLRMGRPKAWLQYGGVSFLQRIIQTSLAAGTGQIVIVVGSPNDRTLVCASEVQALLKLMSVATEKVRVVSGVPGGQPIDSIRAGLNEIDRAFDLLLWPVDHPFADQHLVEALVAAVTPSQHQVAIPCVGDKKGHPVLLGANVWPELRSLKADLGAHHVVLADVSRIVLVKSWDARLVAPINTPEQAAALQVT